MKMRANTICKTPTARAYTKKRKPSLKNFAKSSLRPIAAKAVISNQLLKKCAPLLISSGKWKKIIMVQKSIKPIMYQGSGSFFLTGD